MTTQKQTTTKATTVKKASTTKPRTTAKATPKPTAPKVEKVEVVETPQVQEVVVEEPKFRSLPQIPQHEMFEVRSLVHNPLIYIDKRSGNVYEWMNYGDVEMLPLSDIMTMRNRDRKFIDDMRVSFEDDELIHAFNLVDKYNEVFSVFNEDVLLDRNANELREILPKLPKGVKNSIISRAREIAQQEIESGDFVLLDSTVKMKLIEEHLGLDLSLLLDK